MTTKQWVAVLLSECEIVQFWRVQGQLETGLKYQDY